MRVESEARSYIISYNDLDYMIRKMESKLIKKKADDYYQPNMTPKLGGVFVANSLPGDYVGALASRMADLDITRQKYIDLFLKIKKCIDDYIQVNSIKKHKLIDDQPDDLIDQVAEIIEPDRQEKKRQRDKEIIEEQHQEYQETQELLDFFRDRSII